MTEKWFGQFLEKNSKHDGQCRKVYISPDSVVDISLVDEGKPLWENAHFSYLASVKRSPHKSNSPTPRRKTNKTKSKTETTENQVINKENRGKVSLRTADVFPVVASLPPKNNVW